MQEKYRFNDPLERIQQCLKELGFDAQINISEHEGVVYARKEAEGQCVRVVTHMTDREVHPNNAGAPDFDIRKMRATQVVIRPTLANQTATRYEPDDGGKEPCD